MEFPVIVYRFRAAAAEVLHSGIGSAKKKLIFFVVVEKRGGFSVALPKEGEGEVLDRGVEAGRGSRLKKVDQYFP